MKKLYFILAIILLAVTNTIQAQNDSIYLWKEGQLLAKHSVKAADLDSITFKRLVVNIPSVTICSQVWATKNLDVTTYSDGTVIPQVTDPTAWESLTTGAWCYYNNDPANGAVYGKLYNWYAVAGIYDGASFANPALRKKLAPTGWHVPSDGEWSNLVNCLDPNADGGNTFPNTAGGKMKSTGTSLWLSPNTDATNSSRFTGLPGGYRFNNGTFLNFGNSGYWWSSSETNTSGAWTRGLYYTSGYAFRYFLNKEFGFSVRCLRD